MEVPRFILRSIDCDTLRSKMAPVSWRGLMDRQPNTDIYVRCGRTCNRLPELLLSSYVLLARWITPVIATLQLKFALPFSPRKGFRHLSILTGPVRGEKIL